MDVLITNWLDRANPGAGGAEAHFHEIFERIVARGHRVVAVTSGWRGCTRRDTIKGIEIHRVARRYSYTLRAPAYARGVLASMPRAVLLEDLNKLPLLAPLWSPRPVGVIVHHLFGNTVFAAGPLLLAAGAWLGERVIPRVYHSVPVVAVSESTRTELEDHGIPSSHITLIHNGVDGDYFTPDRAARAPTPTFLYLGRLQRYKRIELLLRAIARLHQAGIAARVIIAGRGPDEARLRALAASLGLAPDIFEGHVTEARKRELYRSAWANVVASDKEGWGITVLEAAACGTPTVATNVPGLRDAVVHDETGFLVPPRDPVALGDALHWLCLRPERVESLGDQARWLAEQHTWDRAAERMELFVAAVRDGKFSPCAWAGPFRGHNPLLHVPLPANGRPPVRYGVSSFVVVIARGDATTHLLVDIGATDPAGQHPIALFQQVDLEPNGSETAPPIAKGFTTTECLPGWPVDPLVFIRARVRSWVAGSVQIDVRRVSHGSAS